MAAEWYGALLAAIESALDGSAAAAETVGEELRAHPVLGPFAVQQVCASLPCRDGAVVDDASIGSGAEPDAACRDSRSVARVLEVLCLAAFESRNTLRALLAALCSDGNRADGGRGALWEAMPHLPWNVKLAMAAHIVPRLKDDEGRLGSVAGGQHRAGMQGMVADLVESAASAAQSALLQSSVPRDERVKVGQMRRAVADLLASADVLALGAATRAVLQALLDSKGAGSEIESTDKGPGCVSGTGPWRGWGAARRATLASDPVLEEAVVLHHLVYQPPAAVDDSRRAAERGLTASAHQPVRAKVDGSSRACRAGAPRRQPLPTPSASQRPSPCSRSRAAPLREQARERGRERVPASASASEALQGTHTHIYISLSLYI